MKKNKLLILLLLLTALLLTGCSGLASVRLPALPPLPTPGAQQPEAGDRPPQGDPFSLAENEPEPTPPPTPEPTPPPTPEPTPDPNIPNLFLSNASYPPENIAQGTPIQLVGEITTDKGVIAMVWGRIEDGDGNIMQECKYFPYSNYFSLAGTVNAKLSFGLLAPGAYYYIVTAIAENNSYSNGEEVLINHLFQVNYP